MKKSELVRLLDDYPPNAEVFIETEDGYTHEFAARDREQVFDGFDTVYEAGINLVMID